MLPLWHLSAVIRACLLAALLFLVRPAWAQDETLIEMKTVSGLRFDPPRFAVKPWAKVRVKVENTDDMAHNFVIVAPGARMEVVTAALTMPITPEQTFIPQSDKILYHTPVLNPGKSATLEFTAPDEGAYPFVCTYPGHGLVMYGVMYVTKKEGDLPALAADENLPEMVRGQLTNLHAYVPEPPYLYRTFLRDSGPASIAVALPDGQNYCWDAGACRLRYAWRGAFVDPMPHWRGNGDAFSEVKGTIYYRAGAGFPLRFGDWKTAPTSVRFRGYRLVERYPEFRYDVAGVEVRELIKPAHHGGIEATYTLGAVKGPVFFVVEPDAGAAITSDAGQFSAGVLKLSPAKARHFTVSFIEIPAKEPLGYWSMNDSLSDKKPLPVDGGIKGRALIFDGKKSQFATGLKSEALAAGATFAIWAQLTKPEAQNQVFIGAHSALEEFALGANLDGGTGFGVVSGLTSQPVKIVAVLPLNADGAWHHFAATLGPKGLAFYLDGKPAGIAQGAVLPTDAEFFLGSSGGAHFAGATLDEARIYGRVLDDRQIAALYESERPKTSPKPVK